MWNAKSVATSVSACLLLLLFPAAWHDAAEEQGKPLPDRWRGLVVDESSPDDAIRILGTPERDVIDRLRVFYINRWVSAKQKDKIFRVLRFKRLQGFDSALLSFLNDRLVLLTLDPDEKIPAAALSRIYGINFYPKFEGIDLALSPGDFERHEGKVYPKTWPHTFPLVAVGDKTFISAYVDNVNPSSLWGVQDLDPNAPPGKVTQIQIISRTLENRDGSDLLK